MASKKVVLLILVLNTIAFGLAVNAERRRNTARVIADRAINSKYCLYNSENVATGYALGACFCLLASQIIVMAASRCLCCGNSLNPGGSRACAIILFIFCWSTFIIAEACLLAGAEKNRHRTNYRSFYGGAPPTCETLRKGVFAAGAAFTLFTTIFAEFYYILYTRARDSYTAVMT